MMQSGGLSLYKYFSFVLYFLIPRQPLFQYIRIGQELHARQNYEKPKQVAVEQKPEPPKKTSTKIGKYIIGALVVLGLCIGGWRISSSVIESSAESEAAAIDTFLNGYEVLVQKAEAARTVEEQETLMPEWEAMGRELSNLTGRLNDEQQQRLDELNTRLEKAELIVPVEVR